VRVVGVASTASLVTAAALLAAACGGGSSPSPSQTPAGTVAALTSQQICERLPLSTLGQITGDTWATAVPTAAPVHECQVNGADGVARIYAHISAGPAGSNPNAVRTVYQSVFESDTRGPDWTAITGLGEKAAFRSNTGSLEVFTATMLYNVQLLSSKLKEGPAVLEADKKILALYAL
jgi:hypothetical protein